MSRRAKVGAIVAAAVAVGVLVWVLSSSGGGGGKPKPALRPPGPAAKAPPARKHARRAHPAHRRRSGGRSTRGLEIALQDDAVFTHRFYYDRERAFAQARALGVSRLRITVLWSRVVGTTAGRRRAPATVPWDFTQYDDVVNAARAHGILPQLSLAGPAPAWATADHRIGPTRPSAAAFGAFARTAADHFRGRVERYSIWNEPNYVSWLRPLAAAPALYRRLYQAGYSAIKGVDPRAQVLIGETAAYGQRRVATPPLAFLRAVACAGCGRLVADGYAHHPYDFTEPPDAAYPGADNVTIGTLGRLTGTLDTLASQGRLSAPGGRPLDVYLTEFGYFARGRRALPAALRARYLTRAFAIAAAHYPRVRQMLQYLLVETPPALPFDTGIVSQAGAESPAYSALAAWSRREQRRKRVVSPLPR